MRGLVVALGQGRPLPGQELRSICCFDLGLPGMGNDGYDDSPGVRNNVSQAEAVGTLAFKELPKRADKLRTYHLLARRSKDVRTQMM